jgi:hypothetical protein
MKTMNKEQLAELLNGVTEYNEVSEEVAQLAKDNNLVIVFGYSDDNTELRGAINNELGTYEGGSFYVNKNGLKFNRCECDDCPNYKLTKEDKKITALWCIGEWAWSYKTDIPHSTFVVEAPGDSDPWCLGIVFSLDDLGGV